MIVLTGSSASGKTEIARILTNNYNITKVVTCTTRPMRHNEIDGIDYHFYSELEFQDRVARGEFLETMVYNKFYYGTRKSDIKLNSVIVLNPEGANAIYQIYKEQATIIYLSTSMDVRMKRMKERNDLPEDIINRITNDDLLFNQSKLNHIDYVIDTSIKTSDELAQTIYGLRKNTLMQ